MRFWC